MQITGNGNDIAYGDVQVGTVQLSGGLEQEEKRSLEGEIVAGNVSYNEITLSRVTAEVSGALSQHRVALAAMGAKGKTSLQADAAGGYEEGVWKGTIRHLQGTDPGEGDWSLVSPAGFLVSEDRLSLEPLTLQGARGERLQVRIDLGLQPLDGILALQWRNLNPSRFDPLIPLDVIGRTTGELLLRWNKGELRILKGQAGFSGVVRRDEAVFTVSQGQVDTDWTGKGLKAGWRVAIAEGGSLRGTITSPVSPRLTLPDKANFAASWAQLNLALINPLIDQEELDLQGASSGEVSGTLSEGKTFSLTLTSRVERGTAVMTIDGRPTAVPLRSAFATSEWKGEDLRGTLTLNAGEKGSIRSDFVVPVPARFPVAFDKRGRMRVNLTANIYDLSVFGPFIPNSIRDVRGQAVLTVDAGGTWERPVVRGMAEISRGGASLKQAELEVKGVNATARLSWNGRGLNASLVSDFGNKGSLRATATSQEEARFGMPDTAAVLAEWNNLDLELLSPFMPEGARVKGSVFGSMQGRLLKGDDLTAKLQASASRARLLLSPSGQGVVTAVVTQARVDARWSGQTLTGQVLFDLSERGRVTGDFLLPLAARLPADIEPAGPLRINVQGRLRERGLVSALMPGLVQETRGQIAINVAILGTWQEPRVQGRAALSDAAAYFPIAGINIKNITATAELSGDAIAVKARAESDPGWIEGTGRVLLQDWNISRYQGTLKGEKFRAVFLPDLRLLVTPDLQFQGTRERVAVQGVVRVSQLLIYGTPGADAAVRESADVIIMDAPPKKAEDLPLQVHAVVKVMLGDDVLIKMRGIDAKLDGSVALKMTGTDDITANGRISVVKGNYSAYGIELDVAKGDILFSGPIERATLNIRAVKEVRDVRAGVSVTGTTNRPVIDLYSEPQLPDSEILSYILFDRPMGGDVAETGLLMRAAGALLSRGESVGFQERLKRTLGLESIEIGAGEGDGGLEETMISVGKYLSPSLYVSFGRSLFTGEYAWRFRYDVTKRIQIETMMGGESGGDIFYKIEFD